MAGDLTLGLGRPNSLDESSFRGLLTWLDGGVDSGGEAYLEMRRRLVSFFARKNCRASDDLADETLNRVARRLAEQDSIADTPAARYCYITAKFVLLEYHRRPARAEISLQEHDKFCEPCGERPAPQVLNGQEQRERCLEACLKNLEASQRQLILDYYHGDQQGKIENRRKLASTLGLSPMR